MRERLLAAAGALAALLVLTGSDPTAHAASSGARRPAALVVDAFDYATPAAAREAWRAVGEGTPEVQTDGRGQVDFPCPFLSANADRLYWDRKVALDLSSYENLELELASDAPGAFRAVSLYLESGAGWYIWSSPLRKAGRQKFMLSKKDFVPDGKPAGWNRISRVRLSPWRGVPDDATLTLASFTARNTAVLVVRGTTSQAEAGEKRIANDVAERIRGWLTVMEIPHGALDDGDVTDAALARASVVILGYNSELPEREYQALDRFLTRGGRLLVCYSSDARLAKRMGFTLGDYRRAEEPLQWCSFSFVDPGEWHVPSRIFQESGNVRPALPASSGAKVIAWWENEQGRRTQIPAWTASPAGLWMSHIPLADDFLGKQHLFAALLAHYVPELWPAIVRPVMDDAGRIDSFRSLAEADRGIRAQAAGTAEEPRVTGLLAEAAQHHASMQTLRARGEFGAVLERGRQLRGTLTEAFARTQRPVRGELRGVWDHTGTGWYPGDWDRSCKLLAESGFNAVFPNMLWGGLAHYESAVLPRSYTFRQHGDQLAKCSAAARASDLQVHVWKVCWSLGNAPADFVARLKREGRLQMNADGATLPWLNPAHPDNVALEIASLFEVASKYDIDGIHLDYIRYPASTACFSPYTRTAFERDSGRKVARWPADARNGGARAAEFQQWRRAQIRGFLARLRADLKKIKPDLKLSAAVFSAYPDCRDTVAQDWPAWIKEGLLDFVCPMTYTENLAEFSSRSTEHVGLAGPGRVYPGIGVSANESRLLADQVIEQIGAARTAGASGFMLFSLNPQLREQILPLLRLGATRPP